MTMSPSNRARAVVEFAASCAANASSRTLGSSSTAAGVEGGDWSGLDVILPGNAIY